MSLTKLHFLNKEGFLSAIERIKEAGKEYKASDNDLEITMQEDDAKIVFAELYKKRKWNGLYTFGCLILFVLAVSIILFIIFSIKKWI